MNQAPKGKIGRLSKAIQEQVNRQLETGGRARTLVAWLNALPEVQALLAAEFPGKPIHEQNLSEWRKHGFQKWLLHHRAWVTQATTSTPDQPLTGQMARWYLLAICKLMAASPGGGPDLKTMISLMHDVVAVRRAVTARPVCQWRGSAWWINTGKPAGNYENEPASVFIIQTVPGPCGLEGVND